MPGTSQALGHYDQMLTNVSHAYMQEPSNFVADQVFPVVPVAKASDVFFKIPKGNFFRDDVQKRPMGGRAAVTTMMTTTDTYVCEEEALAAVIDDRERQNQTNPFNVERSKVRLLTQQHLIHRDRRWAADFFTTGKWGTDVAGVNSGPVGAQVIKWNLSTGTPIDNVDAYKAAMLKATGMEPNVLVLGLDAFIALKNHPTIKELIKYTERAIVTEAILAAALGVEKVVVAKSVFNSAQEGVTEAMGMIVNAKAALLAYAAPAPGLEVPTAGYTFAWNGLLGAGAYDAPVAVARWRDEPAHSDYFEVRMAWQSKVIAPDLGVFFTGVVD